MSYNRYRKRDKSEINRKSEIGLGRVENYDSADISENVIHHVRDYLYTPLYIDLTGDRVGSYGVVKFLESGHTMFITSLNQVDGATKKIYDTIAGSLVYDKPKDVTDIKDCPINFKILGNYETSPVFIDAELTVTVYQERLSPTGPLGIVTYVGIGMDDLRPFGKHQVRAIGTNLHDYTLGAVDYVDTNDPYDRKNQTYLARWTFKISDQIKRDLLAVPLYNTVTSEYVYAADGENYMSGAYDTATINGVPFCGVYGLTVNGKDARHIEVAAKHAGPDKGQAGEHYWEVLKNYPYLKYTADGTKNHTQNLLSQSNDPADKGGLAYLSDFDDAEGQSMDDFMGTLGYWLNENDKEETLSVSSVITVGILRRFWKILKPLLDTSSLSISIANINARLDGLDQSINNLKDSITTINGNITKINNKLEDLDAAIDDLENREPVIIVPDEPEIEEPTETGKTVYLTLSKGSLSFSSPNGSVTDTVVPVGTVYSNWSDNSSKSEGYTSTLMYDWEYAEDVPIKVQIGNIVVSDYDYQEVGELKSQNMTITLTDPENTATFSGYPLEFKTKLDDSHIGTAVIYLSYTNGNVTTHGAIIDMDLDNTYINNGKSSGGSYYPIGSTVEFYMSSEDLEAASNNFSAFINQATSKNGVLEKETRYPITAKALPEDYNFATTETTVMGQGAWKCDDVMETPGVNGYSRTYDLYYNQGQDFFMRLVFKVGALDPYLDLDKYYLTYGPSDDRTERVVASSNFKVSHMSPDYTWINCVEVAEKNYDITVDTYTETSSRTGVVEFMNEAGQTATLQITQTAAQKYICAIPPYINYKDFVKVTPGSSWSTLSTTPDEFVFKFMVESNIPFNVYLNGSYYSSYSSTSGSICNVSVTIPENLTTESVTHTIEVRSELDTITLQITKSGKKDTVVVSKVIDNIFHKEDAFDILRTEKILTITCKDPSKVTLSTSIEDLVAKIYYRDSEKLIVHCYPNTVKVWPVDVHAWLYVTYEDETTDLEFVIEKTTETVGKYFNVSSTIESFVKSDTSDQTITITAFSMGGSLSLSTTDIRSSVLRVGDKQTESGNGVYYNKWDVVVPKGYSPASKTPWTLTLTNTMPSGEKLVKYISIYEATDVAWESTPFDFQFTAFGHLSIADGCEVMGIAYERRRMISYIGTNDRTDSTSPRQFFVPYIIHNLGRVQPTITDDVQNYWSAGMNTIKYSTCSNGGQISSDTHNAIEFTLDNSYSCYFSNSLDTNFYNDLGVAYTSTYGSEYIYSDTTDSTLSRYVVLPSSVATINGICMQVSNPIKYLTNNRAPNFLPVPPDWHIWYRANNMTETATSADGYLTLPALSGDKKNQSFSYLVDSTTNWGNSTTYPNGGKYSVSFYRSDLVVVDEINTPTGGGDSGGGSGDDTGGGGGSQEGGSGSGDTSLVGTVIYDQQDATNSGLLTWSSSNMSFTTCSAGTYQYDNYGPRGAFNSQPENKIGYLKNDRLQGIPDGSKIVTTVGMPLNCATMGKGFSGTSTASGYFSKQTFKDFYYYDIENSVIWDEGVGMYEKVYSLDRRGTILTEGIGEIPFVVKASRGLYVNIGMAGICEPYSNSKAKYLMYVPYIRITAVGAYSSDRRVVEFVLTKYDEEFGLGLADMEQSCAHSLAEVDYRITREVVDSQLGYYKLNVKISSNSGITSGAPLMKPIPNLCMDEHDGGHFPTNGTLDFEITHEDICKLITYHIDRLGFDTERTDNRTSIDPDTWFFYGENSGFDKEQKFVLQGYSWLRDLKVSIQK